MVRLVPAMMNVKVMFVKVEAVAPLMVLLAIQIRIVADIKTERRVPVRNKEWRKR